MLNFRRAKHKYLYAFIVIAVALTVVGLLFELGWFLRGYLDNQRAPVNKKPVMIYDPRNKEKIKGVSKVE